MNPYRTPAIPDIDPRLTKAISDGRSARDTKIQNAKNALDDYLSVKLFIDVEECEKLGRRSFSIESLCLAKYSVHLMNLDGVFDALGYLYQKLVTIVGLTVKAQYENKYGDRSSYMEEIIVSW